MLQMKSCCVLWPKYFNKRQTIYNPLTSSVLLNWFSFKLLKPKSLHEVAWVHLAHVNAPLIYTQPGVFSDCVPFIVQRQRRFFLWVFFLTILSVREEGLDSGLSK